jgi:hypothetical protein
MNPQTTLPPLPEEEAMLLGNKIYPAVEALVGSPSVTGKIVGMLIELKFDPSQDDLRANVIECLEVLKNHRPVDDPRLEELSVLSRHILSRLVPESVSGLPDDSCGLYAFDRKSCTGACQKKHNAYFVSTDPHRKIVCRFFPRCGRPNCWASHESTIVFEDVVCVPPAVASVPPPAVASVTPPAVASVTPPVVAVAKIPMSPAVAVASVPPPVAVADDSKGYIAFCFMHFSNKGCGCEYKDDPKHNAQEFARVGAKCSKLFVTARQFLGYKGLTLNVPGVQANAPPPAPARVPRQPVVAPVRVPQQSVVAGGGGGGIVGRPVYCFAGLSAGQCFLRGCTGCHDRVRFDLDCASSSGLRNAFKNFENGAKKKVVKT